MSPDYSTNDPKGWCGDPTRGASMGRAAIHDAPKDQPIELHLRRVYLDGDYDENGTYWGAGDPLYWYANGDHGDATVDACLRAKNRPEAMDKVRKIYPLATFAPLEAVDPGFLQAYIKCALWISTDHDTDQPLDDKYSAEDLAPATLEKMRAECEKFQLDNAELLAQAYLGSKESPNYDPESAGHDFWLTRNRHGVGFWDRGLGNCGKDLTEAAHECGEVDLCVGGDGKIHQ